MGERIHLVWFLTMKCYLQYNFVTENVLMSLGPLHFLPYLSLAKVIGC